MRSQKTALLRTIVLLFLFIFACCPCLLAGDLESCPEPPFVTAESVTPNILLILDHSGSMNARPPGATSGDTKWNIARTVIKNIIDAFPNVRFGLMRMDASDYTGADQISIESNIIRQGGKILMPCGSDHTAIKNYITDWGATSNIPQTWTALAETLASAGQYFATSTESGSRVGRGPTGFGFYQKNYHTAGCGSTGFLIAPSNYTTANLSVGSQHYLDRTYTISAQPAGFENYTGIKTRNDDKNNATAALITFNLPQTATVYVAYDSRATTLPTWLQSFTLTAMTVTTNENGTPLVFKLYSKSYPAGLVTLGGNKNGGGANASSNYFVYVDLTSVPAPSSGCDATTTDDQQHDIDTTSPIQYHCQKSFIIFITDGLSNYDNDWSVVTDVIGDYDGDHNAEDCKHGTGCANESDGHQHYFDDVAKYLHDNDMRSDLVGTQNLSTYVVGFGMGAADTSLLSRAAANGGGVYSPANDTTGLTNALTSAISAILASISSGTAVSTISTSSQTNDYLVRAKFLPVSWKGYLEKFLLPYTEGSSTAIWEAGQILSTTNAASRTIYTYMSLLATKQQNFVSSNTDLLSELSATWSVTTTQAGEMVDFLRGDSTHEGTTYNGITYRNRGSWPLGDIIYSTPLVIGQPSGYYSEHAYQTFKQNNANRATRIYVGANDGMLHAFNDSGVEQWAFVPENVYADLKSLIPGGCHKYYVDLSPVGADIWDPAPSPNGTWKTILIGGNRLGGNEYFALDVTNPSATSNPVLWDTVVFSDRKSSTVPAIGKISTSSGEKWVSIITSGYHEGSSDGQIAALDVLTGQKVAIWVNGATGSTPLVDLLSTQAKSAFTYYSLTSPTVVDSDHDGYLDLIYAGDTEGTLWKFYYDYVDLVWRKVAFFSTGGEPITGQPDVVPDDTGKLRILFGTGKYLVNPDKSDTLRNAYYCVIDSKSIITDPYDPAYPNNGHYTNSPASAFSKTDLCDVTDATTQDLISALSEENKLKMATRGWYFSLQASGGYPTERVVEQPVTVAGKSFFTSFMPTEDVCGYGGTARLYFVDYKTGLQARTSGGAVVSGATGNQRYKELGSGLPSKPLYHYNRLTGQDEIIVQTSDTQIHQETVDLGVRPMGITSWRNIEN